MSIFITINELPTTPQLCEIAAIGKINARVERAYILFESVNGDVKGTFLSDVIGDDGKVALTVSAPFPAIDMHAFGIRIIESSEYTGQTFQNVADFSSELRANPYFVADAHVVAQADGSIRVFMRMEAPKPKAVPKGHFSVGVKHYDVAAYPGTNMLRVVDCETNAQVDILKADLGEYFG